MSDLPTLRAALPVWIRIAVLSFGGPAGQIAVMHRILVEEKRWISDTRFLHALNYCMLLPGPEAQQLATFIGWLMHRTRGGLVAGGLFILPGIVAIMTLSIIYALFGTVSAVVALFFGLKSAVLVIVMGAIQRLGRKALKSPAKLGIAAAAFMAIFFFHIPFPLIIIAAALTGFFGVRHNWAIFLEKQGHGEGKAAADDSLLRDITPDHAIPRLGTTIRTALFWGALWLAPTIALVLLLGPDNIFSQIAIFFSKMAVVTFGGAYAVLAYVAQQAVESFHWLNPREMLDGLGMAETTPGPLIMVLQFVGFLAAYRADTALSPLWSGVLGGLLATWVTFMPCFLWVFTGGPFVEALRANRLLNGALAAITAAIVGVVLNLGLWLAIHTLFAETRPVRDFGLHFDMPVWTSINPFAVLLSVGAGIATFRLHMSMLTVLALCALASLLVSLI